LRNVTAAVLPLIVAALAILAFHYAYSLATVKAVYRTNAQREIALDVLRLERFFAERQSILIGIARTMTVPAGDLLNNMGELTESESQLGAFFEGLYLDDLDGNVVGTHGERFNVSDRPYFEAVKRGRNSFSDILVSRGSGNRIVVALVPIRDPLGAVVGALGGAIPVGDLLNEIALAERAGSQAVLLDRSGTLLASSSLGAGEQRAIADAIARSGPEIGAAGEVAIPIDGRDVRYLMAQGELPQLGWRLGLLWPSEAIESGARRNAFYGLFLSIVLIGLAAAFSLWSTRRVLAPLQKVAESIRALSRGDRNVRAPVAGEDDIAQIGMAFNDMAANLASHERELKEQAALLEKQARGLEIANVQYAEEREAALAANRSKSEFLANMSHELRTPLNAVLGFSELLMAMPGAASSDVVARYAGEIHSAGRMLLTHIDAILAYAQLDARGYTPETAPVAIGDIVRGAVQIVEQRASSKGLRIKTELAEPLPPIVVDAAAIRRVLLQLLSNAVKFTAQGGTIQVEVPPPQGHELVIRVRDDGVGIAPDQLDRVFEPFWQAEPALTRSTAGLGLGLAYAKRLIEINGGRIAIESNPGVGTTVTCYLPLAA
jgi:signal transduction histidine kinase